MLIKGLPTGDVWFVVRSGAATLVQTVNTITSGLSIEDNVTTTQTIHRNLTINKNIWTKWCFRLSVIDYFVASIWLITIFATQHSSLPISWNLFYIRNITTAVLFYFILRSGYLSTADTDKLLLLISLFAGVTSLLAIVSFLYFSGSLAAVGLADVYDFRFLYHPVGTSANTWGAYSLTYVGIIALTIYRHRKKRTGVIWLSTMLLPVVFSLIVTFSRGVYISYGLLLVVLAISVCRSHSLTRNRKLLVLVCCGVIHAGIIFPVRHEVLRTLDMTATVSQQKSIEGRIAATQAAFDIFKQHPLTGVGPGNYSLVADRKIYDDDNQSFLSTSPTIVAPLLAERGIIFLILCVGTFVIITIRLWKKQKRTWCDIWIYSVLGVIAVREASLPMCFEKTGLLMFVFLFVALLVNSIDRKAWVVKVRKPCVSLFCFPLLVAGAICSYAIVHQRNERSNTRFLACMQNNDLIGAEQQIATTPLHIPYLINRGLLYLEYNQITGDSTYLNRAGACFDQAAQMNNYDNRIKHYQAIVRARQGEAVLAEAQMEKLVWQSPANTLYRLSLSKLQYERGEFDSAAGNLTQAILLSPQLLDTQYWNDIVFADSSFGENIMSRLVRNIDESKDDNPVIQAKQGKILLAFGDIAGSQRILEQVVIRMPNLSRPWCYLGLIYRSQGKDDIGSLYIERALALDPGDSFTSHCLSSSLTGMRDAEMQDGLDFLESKYAAKFKRWYRSEKAPVIIY